MIVNIIDIIFLLPILGYCIRRPIAGIIGSLIIILSVSPFFYTFGIAFGSGAKYLPNLTIVVFAYTLFYFWQAGKRGKLEGLDLALIAYLVAVFAVSLYVSEFTANPGIIVKAFATPLLFYFMGEVFALDEENFQDNYLRLRKYLLLLGPYFIMMILLEYVADFNFFPGLLAHFSDLVGVGENVLFDPLKIYRMVAEASFHRVLGPILEPTETAMVMMMVFTFYLPWTEETSWPKFRKFVLIMLPALIVLSTSRTVMLATLAVIGAWYAFNYHRNKKALVAYACVVLVLAGFFASGGGERFFQEESYDRPIFGRLGAEYTVEGRVEAMKDAWDMAKDHILLGIGVGTEVDILASILYEEGVTGLTVHNFYLDNLLFKGILLSAALAFIYFILIRRSFSLFRLHENEFIGKVALTHLLLTVGMLTFYLATMEKLQIAALFWFYGGMIRGIRAPGEN